MAEFEYDEDFQREETKQEVVQELLKFNIYGDQTNLDGIVEAAEKNLNKTIVRVKELKTLFGDEDKKDENYLGIVPSLEVENSSGNKDAPSRVETEEELVQKLIKFKVYGNETTLDGIIQTAKKNLSETKARFAEYETLSGNEENNNEKHSGIVPSSSTSIKILTASTELNLEAEHISGNKVAPSVTMISNTKKLRQSRKI